MKRPLCLLAILVTVAAFFLNVFKYSSVIAENGPSDKSYMELVGKVHNKELKKDLSGNDISVIYLIPTGQENRDFEMVQCYLDPSMSLAPSIGEYVRVCGKVKTFSRPTNPGEFDSYLYYSTLKISYRLTGTTILETGGKKSLYKESLYQVKIFFERALDKILSEKDSSIMKAMLLGDRAFIDEETKDMYKNSGIMHTLAVSGLHISIIGMGLYRLLKALMEALLGFVRLKLPLGKRTMLSGVFWKGLPTGIAILVMYSYGIMCGMGSSSFRAICMFIIRLLAPMAGRTYDVLSALSVAAILLLLDQPLYLYNSGFLFSFGAVVGLTVIKPAL
ncbi:MAG: ComEC/Rec2 family competence protein, partial [Butyrivibrio sp.]|nr:ComEC/Rec2 family competence protein [Butyrivibrio sp.]